MSGSEQARAMTGRRWKDRVPGYRRIGRLFRLLRDAAISAPLWGVVLICRLLAPLVTIRFGVLRSSRIGHFAVETDLYLCERQAALHPPRSRDLFALEGPPCNETLARLFRRRLFIHAAVRRLDRMNRKLPGGEAHVARIIGRDTVWSPRDTHDLLSTAPPNVQFAPADEERGRRELERIGMPEGARFVCIHNRDSAYLRRQFSALEWGYHDYRDFPIGDFNTAIEELVRRGYYVVRMGQDVEEPLQFDSPRVIDYATRHRSDFLDVYLPARCRFFVGNTSGLFYAAALFRRPVVLTNIVPLESLSILSRSDLAIFKLLRRRSNGELLTLDETIGCGAAQHYQGEQLSAAGLEAVNNTPQEILEAVIEMDDRLDGRWTPRGKVDDVQAIVSREFGDGKLLGELRCRLGSEFLQRHAGLLQLRTAAHLRAAS